MEQPTPGPSTSKPSSSSATNEQNITLEKYRIEWSQLSSGIEEVRRRALTGALRVSRLRSIAWALVLKVLPENSQNWITSMRENRELYKNLVKKYICNPRNPNDLKDDPLSQKDESVWNQYFQNNDLQSTIKLDVVRTFPGVEIFKQDDIRNVMANVLFIYAKDNPALEYRQGMHEILAPILFVLHCDHRAAEYATLGDELNELMDPKFMEHDAFSLFKAMMKGIEKFYSIHEFTSIILKPSKGKNSSGNGEKIVENEVVRYLRLVKDDILSVYDSDLTEHLNKQDIPLSLFGIRWLRVLFGREFPLQDLLVLWDVILAEGGDFSLAGYVLVAMLIAVKRQLLGCDSMGCLIILLNYPATVDVQYIIDYALYLRHPDLYCKPKTRHFELLPIVRRNDSQPTNISTSKTGKSDNKSVNMDKFDIGVSVEESVIDGFLCQDTSYVREELVHAQKIMSICSSRLEKNEKTLRQYIPKGLPNTHPAYQALDDMLELGELLKFRHGNESIEPAFEANESESAQSVQNSKTTKRNLNESTGMYDNKTVPTKRALGKEVQLKTIDVEETAINNTGLPRISPFGTEFD